MTEILIIGGLIWLACIVLIVFWHHSAVGE
jgi:hypothetical protein